MKLDFRAKRGRAESIWCLLAVLLFWLFIVIFAFRYYNYGICLLLDSIHSIGQWWGFLSQMTCRACTSTQCGGTIPAMPSRMRMHCANASVNGSWLNWHNTGRKWLSVTLSFHMCHAAAVCTHWWEAEQTFAPQKKKNPALARCSLYKLAICGIDLLCCDLVGFKQAFYSASVIQPTPVSLYH